MNPVKFEEIEVDRCASCHGLWFDAHEDRMLRARKGAGAIDIGAPAAGAARDTQRKMHCPKDGTPMVRMVDREQTHVWFESCSVCHGSFFDAGEFRDLKGRGLGDFFRRMRKGPRKLD
jgi:Zn-finger nucleic acid-binding protein